MGEVGSNVLLLKDSAIRGAGLLRYRFHEAAMSCPSAVRTK